MLYEDSTRTLHGLYSDSTQTLLGLYPDSTRTLIFDFFMKSLLGLYSDSTRTLLGLYSDFLVESESGPARAFFDEDVGFEILIISSAYLKFQN